MGSYYEVLNVSTNASPDEIKSSFRSLALKCHPDKNRNSEESKRAFMELIEAYEVLSDEFARRNYDSTEISTSHSSTAQRAWTPPADFEQIYSYSRIKRKYGKYPAGGIWDISEAAASSLWKATIALFAGLGAIVVFILMMH